MYYTERMHPRPLPRLVRSAGECAGLHPLAAILVLSPFVLLAVAGGISVRHVALETGNLRYAVAGVSPVFVLAVLGSGIVLPALVAGLRDSWGKSLADRVALLLTRSGAQMIFYVPVWFLVVFVVTGFSTLSLPLGPYGTTLWALVSGAVACLVSGRFFEKIGSALESRESPAGSRHR